MTLKSKEKFQNQVFKVIASVVFVAFIILTIWGENGLLKWWNMHAIKSNLESENQKLLQENLKFHQEIELLRSELGFIEQKARTELGMVRSDEVVIMVPEDSH